MGTRELYTFGEFTLDVTERRLVRRGTSVHVSPKAYDVLVALVRHAGRLVTKNELTASFEQAMAVDVSVSESTGASEESVAAVKGAVAALQRASERGDTGRRCATFSNTGPPPSVAAPD